MDEDEWERRRNEIVARSTPEQQRVLQDARDRLETRLQRQRDWVLQLRELGSDIERRGDHADWRTLELFWIRLYGTVSEIGGAYAEHLRFLGPQEPDEPNGLQLLRLLNASAETILRTLSEPEVIVIDWLRQRAAHVKQRGYGLQYIKKNGTVKEQRGFELLGNKPFTVDEMDAALETVLRQYGGDEVAMQVGLARKVLPGINTFVLTHEMSLGF